MRTHVKKKKYAEHVRMQTLAGMTTNAEGSWVNGQGNSTNASQKNVLQGTRGKAGRRRRSRAKVELE